MNQIKKNFIYNVIYQLLSLVLPLITVPYVSRVLGPSGVGIYSYTYSIAYYFMLFSMLGIKTYGNRVIAKTAENKKELSKNFISIYIIQLIMTSLMIIAYLTYIMFFNNNYKTIAIIQILFLVSCLFDINWFFFGLERFKLTVSRNIIVKIISLIGIFIFVKTSKDLWIYTLILSLGTLVSMLLLIPFLVKEICFVKVEKKDILKHVKPILVLFIPVIAISLYKIMDKIMIGKLSVINEVGYYEQAEKIINIPMGIVTALGTVMLPRISNLVSKGENEKVLLFTRKSINFMMFLAFPICFGLIAISSNFVPIFLGKGFIKTSQIIYYLAPTILLISFADVIRNQYLIPKEKDKVFVISVVGGAIINLTINFILIPKYHSIGACFGTIIAELFVMLYQTISVKNKLPIKDYFKDCIKYFYKSIIMFAVIMLIKFINLKPIVIVTLQVFSGVLIYSILNYKYIKDNSSLPLKFIKLKH